MIEGYVKMLWGTDSHEDQHWLMEVISGGGGKQRAVLNVELDQLVKSQRYKVNIWHLRVYISDLIYLWW